MADKCFIPFKSGHPPSPIPDQLNDPFDPTSPAICQTAASELQAYLTQNQASWQHNFGLSPDPKSPAKGKMFGVLVVENAQNKIGYLATFSGKMEDEPHPDLFVPSLFEISTNDHFITKGMTELSKMGEQIKKLQAENNPASRLKIQQLKTERKTKSVRLQDELFDQYHFLNKAGNTKSLRAIFEAYNNKKPPSGAGECAAPKLLQYAYAQHMKPLAIAEFWWGKSTKSNDKKHKAFYPSCHDKCRPILNYMLSTE